MEDSLPSAVVCDVADRDAFASIRPCAVATLSNFSIHLQRWASFDCRWLRYLPRPSLLPRAPVDRADLRRLLQRHPSKNEKKRKRKNKLEKETEKITKCIKNFQRRRQSIQWQRRTSAPVARRDISIQLVVDGICQATREKTPKQQSTKK